MNVEFFPLKEDLNEEIKKKNLKKNKIIFTKFLVFLFVIIMVILTRQYAIPENFVECMIDPFHDFFTIINTEIHNNLSLASFLQISSSFLMDFIFFTTYFYWIFYSKSSRFVITCLFFYSLRYICQFIILMRIPPGYYWKDPGFPSLVVPYGNTTDFFYSGHVGFLNISAMEYYKEGLFKMTFITSFIIIYMIFVLMCFRGHYTVDMIAGLITSNWIFTHVDLRKNKIDDLFKKCYKKLF